MARPPAAHDTRPDERGGHPLAELGRFLLEGLALLIIFATLYLGLLIGDALMTPPPL